MSLLSQLNAAGVTAEDLEKAASVRLFEKAAAAEGIHSTELRTSVDSINNNQTQTHIMENHMDMIDLFEKQASDEGIDLDLLDDYELAELYNHFVDDVADEDDFGYEDEYEKLAEAELLGEVMADAYLDKVAAVASYGTTKGGRLTNAYLGEGYRDNEGGMYQRSKGYGKKLLTEIGGIGSTAKNRQSLNIAAERMMKAKDISKAEAIGILLRRRGAGRVAGGLGAAGALGAGAMALAKKRREKKAAAYDEAGSAEYKPSGKKDAKGVKQRSFLQSVGRRSQILGEGVGRAFTSQARSELDAKKIEQAMAKMNPKEKAKLLKSLGKKGYRGADLAAMLGHRKLVRRGGMIGAGAGIAAAGAGYAASRMNKKASLIEELALEKAASAFDGDFEFEEIDILSDELANEILEDAMYDDLY